MRSLKVLICGGGCTGPSLAYWLARTGHRVVVVERYEALRASGAQVDIRAQGIDMVKRMGLMDAIRSKLVDEAGVHYIDSQGNVWATAPVNKSGKGAQGPTSEYEIMRGDLVRVLYDATKDKVEYIFGKTVERFEQDDNQVTAYFSDGSSDTFDLLVGADGQGSRIRKAMLPADAPSPYRDLGVYIAYWFIPHAETDDNFRRIYHIPGRRLIMRRSHSPTESHVYFIFGDDSPEVSSLTSVSVEQQKEFWVKRFSGAGWETERFLEGLKATDNFYCQKVVQVHTDTWHKGRVVLLGDAAHCPSPFTGMGTSGGFVGAYVLAGEINRNVDDLPQALRNYESTLRPFVNEIQELNPFILKVFLPETQWAISIMRFFGSLFSKLKIPELLIKLLTRFRSGEEEDGWKVPEYAELSQDR